MSTNCNDCLECDIAHRCGRCDIERKKYTCPMGGPYVVLEVMALKGKDEIKRNRDSQLSTASI